VQQKYMQLRDIGGLAKYYNYN